MRDQRGPSRGKAISSATARYRTAMATSTADTDEATRLRNAMVDAWSGYGLSLCERVEQAMRTIPRHTFLPDFAFDVAYDERSVVTHRDGDGAALSSATAPGDVAEMLEQLDVRPGHRILEIGAGTGYNAALLAHLSGPAGQVTTIDINPAVAKAAQEHLAAAGYGNVQVICGDGLLGHVDRAPYDRIIVTAGAWDIPPAWTRQAAAGGRMVVPLRISGYSCRVAVERAENATWRSLSCELDGFIPMRGAGCPQERNTPVVDHGRAELRTEAHLPIDADALRRATQQAPTQVWTGAKIIGWNRTSLAIWLAPLGGTGWLFGRQPGHGLASLDSRGVRLAILDTQDKAGDTFAYLTYRPAAEGNGEEIGVYAYGRNADQLAERVAERVRVWAIEAPTLRTWLEIHPAGTTTSWDDVLFSVDKKHTRIVVRSARRTDTTAP